LRDHRHGNTALRYLRSLHHKNERTDYDLHKNLKKRFGFNNGVGLC